MQTSKLWGAALALLRQKAGSDEALTKSETKGLPALMRDAVERVRKGSAPVPVADAFTSLRYGSSDGTTPGLEGAWVLAQTSADQKPVSLTNLSQAERARITQPAYKEATDVLWALAESMPPGEAGVAYASVTAAQVNASARLLTALLRASDNGDGLTRVVEIGKADFRYRGQPDPHTTNALVTAVNRAKNKGDPTIDGVAAQIELARKEVVALNTDGDGTISPKEQAKPRTELATLLLAFTRQHPTAKKGDFSFTPEKIYVPTRAFRAPAGATAGELLDALLKHFDAFSNDNKGAGADGVTRYVLGDIETKGFAAEIAKLTPARAKAVLAELEARVQMPTNALGPPRRVYFTGPAQTLIDAVAKKFGVSHDFAGDPRPPSFDYY